MKKGLITLIAIFVLVGIAYAETFTTFLNLSKPAKNETDWHINLNSNFDIIDTAIGTEHFLNGTHQNITNLKATNFTMQKTQDAETSLTVSNPDASVSDDVKATLKLTVGSGPPTTGEISVTTLGSPSTLAGLYVGSTSNIPTYLKTNSTNRVYIGNNAQARVGIGNHYAGNLNPRVTLDVTGPSTASKGYISSDGIYLAQHSHATPISNGAFIYVSSDNGIHMWNSQGWVSLDVTRLY